MTSKLWLSVGVMILLVLATSALLAPVLAPHDPMRQNLAQDLITYSGAHPLGTDKLGRDILSRTIYGGRISLIVGISTVALSLTIGFVIGSLSGFCGGWGDQAAMRRGDIFIGFSRIPLAIPFTSVFRPRLHHPRLPPCFIGWASHPRRCC